MMRELELYVHIPFCVRKCAYCDFLSGPAADEQKQAYFDALIQEVRICGGFSGYVVTSVFFGGGTPSIFPGEWIEKIMDEIRIRFRLKEDAEITIEANPGTVDAEKMRAYRRAGINRISFGCQSANDQELQMLGRIHTWDEFLESYHLARKYGFENINVDLMSGLPGQTAVSWKETLQKVISLSPEHISAYSLILEEGTPFYDMQDRLNLPDEEEERLMYEQTAQILQQYAYEQYEISNYAKAGKSCAHNIGYWTGREYLGLGLGSASLINKCRFRNTDSMEKYLKHITEPTLLREDVQPLSPENEMEEFMILGLRMNCGVSEKEFEERFGVSMETVYGDILQKYIENGFLRRENGRVFFSRAGISVSNMILSEMLL